MKAEKVEPLDQVIDHEVGGYHREKGYDMDAAGNSPPPPRMCFRMEIASVNQPGD